MNSVIEWLSLSLAPGLGPRSWKKLLEAFENPGQVLQASLKELQNRTALSGKVLSGIQPDRLRKAAEKELKKADQAGVAIVTQKDSSYPDLLENIHDPPPLLYVKGNLELLNGRCVGMVGARAATTYGKRIALDFARRLSLQGVTVVSGLALGIDTAAHQGALQGTGDTIGVLGCGVDVIYPRQNKSLYESIASKGAVISEYPFGTKPDAFRFPARNRIISGLSQGIIVIEAARKSGSLITADFALEQGREVFAIPGRVDSAKSEGTHRLLQNGATLVHTVSDIMEELDPAFYFTEKINSSTPEQLLPDDIVSDDEKKLLNFIDIYPQSIDEIIQQCGMSPQKVNELLLTLELKGVVEALAGKQFQRVATIDNT